MEYYTLAIIDNGIKKYYAESGWITDKENAVWFTEYENAVEIAFDEGLEEDEMIIEKGWY